MPNRTINTIKKHPDDYKICVKCLSFNKKSRIKCHLCRTQSFYIDPLRILKKVENEKYQHRYCITLVTARPYAV